MASKENDAIGDKQDFVDKYDQSGFNNFPLDNNRIPIDRIQSFTS